LALDVKLIPYETAILSMENHGQKPCQKEQNVALSSILKVVFGEKSR
jgi:hypothetical protein